MNTQYKKGVLELCVLSLLKKRDCYGYEISEFLAGHIDIADGTVYPILRKLKADGMLTTYLQEESGGAGINAAAHGNQYLLHHTMGQPPSQCSQSGNWLGS